MGGDIRAVMDECPDVRLAIVGAGPEEEELKRVFKGTKVGGGGGGQGGQVLEGVLKGTKAGGDQGR